MKSVPHKDGVIYKGMHSHRLKKIRSIIILFIVLVLYFVSCKPYITNVLFGSVPLDMQRFKSEAELVSLKDDTAQDKKVPLAINSKVIKNNSYWQDGKYEFDISLSDVEKTPITYTTKNTDASFSEGSSEEVKSAVLYTAKINGVDTLVLAYPHDELKDGSKVTGIFAELPPVVKKDLCTIGNYAQSEVYKYMLDTRGIRMESEDFDITVFTALLLAILFLIVQLSLYFINPYLTPTYRGLEKYGEITSVIEDVEAQLKEKDITKVTKKQPAYTEDWIVSEDVFKLKVAKNHAKPQDSSRYGSKL